VLTLARALANARAQQPSLRQARAATDAARARVGQATAPMYPQLNGSAAYQLTTANFVARPGQFPGSLTPARPEPNFELFHYWTFGLSATQLVYDFGQTPNRRGAAQAMVEAQGHSEREAQLQVAENVRTAFFAARAAKALLTVARDNLANQERHVAQTEGFVRAGARAEIDLAQVRTDRANARVGLINAENGYASAKARLKQAMGSEHSGDFELGEDSMPPVPGEDGSLDALVGRALKTRPQFLALQRQVRAQELTASAIRGSRWPALGISTAGTEAGVELDNLTWNWNAGATLTWRIFEGGLVSAQVDEARANRAGVQAQLDALRQQVRLDVEQAQLSVRATHAVLGAADEAVANARERLRLAEGRYQTGVGSGLELADAQLALASAEAQRVQAEYNLSAARSQLTRALGEGDGD
jgi:outer membrane protein